MRMLSFFTLLILFNACKTGYLKILPSNELINYNGRVDRADPKSYKFFWPGTSVKVKFIGTSIGAMLQDERGENYYNVIIDDSLFILKPGENKCWYEIASGLEFKEHSLELFKRTEYDKGATIFFGFRIPDKGKFLEYSSICNRTIEFFGNSITSGYGVEDYSGNDSPDSIYTNNYLSYAAITARHYNANYYCTSKSGIGIMVSWFPEIISDIWNRLDPTDPNSKWNFSEVQPDIVVINLFQNDSRLVKMASHPSFIKRFGKQPPGDEFIVSAYKEFINQVKEVYPKASIICALGNMDATKTGSPWPEYIDKAVMDVRTENGDTNIFSLTFPFKDTPGHPKIVEQEEMAKRLIDFIDHNIKW